MTAKYPIPMPRNLIRAFKNLSRHVAEYVLEPETFNLVDKPLILDAFSNALGYSSFKELLELSCHNALLDVNSLYCALNNELPGLLGVDKNEVSKALRSAILTYPVFEPGPSSIGASDFDEENYPEMTKIRVNGQQVVLGGQSNIGIITGVPRSGKSVAALECALDIMSNDQKILYISERPEINTANPFSNFTNQLHQKCFENYPGLFYSKHHSNLKLHVENLDSRIIDFIILDDVESYESSEWFSPLLDSKRVRTILVTSNPEHFLSKNRAIAFIEKCTRPIFRSSVVPIHSNYGFTT